MGKTVEQRFSLNLAEPGDFFDYPTLGLDSMTFQGLDVPDWGSAVVEIQKVNAGQAESYGSAKEIKVTGSLFRQPDIDTETSQYARAVVKTADPTKTFGHLIMLGEGKD